ncbi:hypothetical protein LN042_36255 [Kitasatospora sp. RB6PN24]|uniref:hypothetical protein n=1 Tax=Kitasatospora humi TaxID=2893891 RepID=UPI001E423712|nr:hypothetical protein [Kitasatospora humi]MCC9312445.1 hypothetical protein [Kitasatospora humi]
MEGNALKDIREVLRQLAQQSNIAVHSTARLVGELETAAAKDDDEREEKELDALRRKQGLQLIPAKEVGEGVQLTPWKVLHTLGRAIALSRRGAGRGLAEHWGCLKYSQALEGTLGTFMALSAEGRDTADYYKALQSDELGVGFALALAKHVLARRFPDHSVSIVPADTALRARFAVTGRDSGTSVGYRYRPQYFAEVWAPGQPSRVFPIACKGNHSGASVSHTQLASGAVHADAVHIGGWTDTPALIFSTEIPVDGPMTVHALQACGNGGKLSHPAGAARDLDKELDEDNIFPGIQPPAQDGETPEPVPGFHIQPGHYAWFQHALARTGAAGLTAFAGDADATVPYLTNRQGRKRYEGISHAAIGSVQDAEHELLGIPFVGTDHVFRLNRTRVEAFSGVAQDLFEHLANNRLTSYRDEAHARRASSPTDTWDDEWDGPVSVHPDGSVLALRVLPTKDH